RDDENAAMKPSGQKKATLALRNWKWRVALIYLTLLVASHVVTRTSSTDTNVRAGSVAIVKAIDGERKTEREVRIAYQEYGSNADPARPTVVLVHGSPGHKEDFRSLAPELAKRYRVIAPDLPGFGSSTASVPDYSIRAHARYVIELMDALGIERAHLLGFSMGGGVVLNIADIAPQRVASITMLSAHGVQTAAIWLWEVGVPHFGLLGHSMLDSAYARNFYDSDQRPLREILSRFE